MQTIWLHEPYSSDSSYIPKGIIHPSTQAAWVHPCFLVRYDPVWVRGSMGSKWFGYEVSQYPYYDINQQLMWILVLTGWNNPEKTIMKWGIPALSLNVFNALVSATVSHNSSSWLCVYWHVSGSLRCVCIESVHLNWEWSHCAPNRHS